MTESLAIRRLEYDIERLVRRARDLSAQILPRPEEEGDRHGNRTTQHIPLEEKATELQRVHGNILALIQEKKRLKQLNLEWKKRPLAVNQRVKIVQGREKGRVGEVTKVTEKSVWVRIWNAEGDDIILRKNRNSISRMY